MGVEHGREQGRHVIVRSVIGEEAADLGGEIGDVLEQEAVARIRVEDELGVRGSCAMTQER